MRTRRLFLGALVLVGAALGGSAVMAPSAHADWYRGGPGPYGWHGGPYVGPRPYYPRYPRYGYGYGYRPYYPPRPPFYVGPPPVIVTPGIPTFAPPPPVYFGY